MVFQVDLRNMKKSQSAWNYHKLAEENKKENLDKCEEDLKSLKDKKNNCVTTTMKFIGKLSMKICPIIGKFII